MLDGKNICQRTKKKTKIDIENDPLISSHFESALN